MTNWFNDLPIGKAYSGLPHTSANLVDSGKVFTVIWWNGSTSTFFVRGTIGASSYLGQITDSTPAAGTPGVCPA